MNPSGRMFVHQVTESNDTNFNFQNKVGKLHELISNKPEKERVLAFCDYRTVRRAALLLRAKGIRACVFTNDMLDEGPALIESEKDKLDDLKLGICSFDVFEESEFPVVENFIILELPSKTSRLPKLLNQLNEQSKNRVARIDIIASLSDNAEMIEALRMEITQRKCAMPNCLSKVINLKNASLYDEVRLVEEDRLKCDAAATPNSLALTTGSSFSIPTRKESFDIRNLRPNADGKYVVPAKMIAFADEGESDDDDYYFSEEDKDNEADYNYEEYFV